MATEMNEAELEAKARELWESRPPTHFWPTWEKLPEDFKVIWRYRASIGEEPALW